MRARLGVLVLLVASCAGLGEWLDEPMPWGRSRAETLVTGTRAATAAITANPLLGWAAGGLMAVVLAAVRRPPKDPNAL